MSKYENRQLGHTVRYLKQFGACKTAIGWLREQDNLDQAWRDCRHGGWMLWVLMRTCIPDNVWHRRIVYTACQCARLALPYLGKSKPESQIAIELAEAWSHGEAGSSERLGNAVYWAGVGWEANPAAYAAWLACCDTSPHCSLTAINNSIRASRSAYFVAVRVADVIACDNDEYVDIHAHALHRCADIVREHVPNPPLILRKC